MVERGCRNGVRHSSRNRDDCGDENDDPTASKEFDEVLDFHVSTFTLSTNLELYLAPIHNSSIWVLREEIRRDNQICDKIWLEKPSLVRRAG